jgi:hypothetical protein
MAGRGEGREKIELRKLDLEPVESIVSPRRG